MITLIGTRCTQSNLLSRGVLIARFLLGNLEIKLLKNRFRNKILMLYPAMAGHVFELTVLVVCRRGHTSSHSEQRS